MTRYDNRNVLYTAGFGNHFSNFLLISGKWVKNRKVKISKSTPKRCCLGCFVLPFEKASLLVENDRQKPWSADYHVLNYTFKVQHSAAFRRCRAILKTVKNMTVAKFEQAFTQYHHNLKTIEQFTIAEPGTQGNDSKLGAISP